MSYMGTGQDELASVSHHLSRALVLRPGVAPIVGEKTGKASAQAVPAVYRYIADHHRYSRRVEKSLRRKIVKRFKLKGQRIKALRQGRERRATQKEFAYELRISERQLRKIERQDLEVGAELLDRLSATLNVSRDELVYANAHPRLVSNNPPAFGVKWQPTECSQVTQIPRFYTYFATATDDETRLLDDAKNCHIVILHVHTKLTVETEKYAEELLDLMQSVTWKNRGALKPLDGRQELLLRRRLRELLVLLKGNDVWVYLTNNTKLLPESMIEVPDRSGSSMELQTIIAFGPPGEYGEDTLKVPVDNGQPRTIELAPLFG